MVDKLLLKYPLKSHRKQVKIPSKNVQLAEFVGIMLGDGGINNPWQANVTLNTDKDAQYIHYVASCMSDLFGVQPAIRERKGKRATVVSLTSTTLVDYLVSIGLPRGNKHAQELCMPKWVLTKKAYKFACVRGLVDTDGCIINHTHKVLGNTYKNVYVSFCSYSPSLLEQVAEVWASVGLSPHFSTSKKEILLYNALDVQKYIKCFGSSNDRILRVYKKWRDG